MRSVGHDYRGWLEVEGGEGQATSRVTIHLQTHDDVDVAEVERSLRETLGNIQAALGAP